MIHCCEGEGLRCVSDIWARQLAALTPSCATGPDGWQRGQLAHPTTHRVNVRIAGLTPTQRINHAAYQADPTNIRDRDEPQQHDMPRIASIPRFDSTDRPAAHARSKRSGHALPHPGLYLEEDAESSVKVRQHVHVTRSLPQALITSPQCHTGGYESTRQKCHINSAEAPPP